MVNIDINRLTYGDYRAFQAGELDEIDVLTRVVTTWDFAGDPSDRVSYDALGMVDLLVIQQALRHAIQTALSAEGNSAAPSL